MLITWKWLIGTVLLMAAFSAVIGVLMWKILQLNRTIRVRRDQKPAPPPKKDGKPEAEESAPPPPWAGAKNAKTTVFVFPTLIVQDSSDLEHRYRLSFEDFNIGRAADNELVIARPEVSPHHARIVLDEQGYSLQDLGSQSGTLVNGERVREQHRLQHMDAVVIGDATITFEAT
jgi:pSer/pThr/pTyr-binding forkhead associated (FHA) protein